MMTARYLRLRDEVRFFIDGGWVFCATVDRANKQPVKLNSTASYLWYLISQNLELSEVESRYAARYGIDQAEASNAVEKFLAMIDDYGWGSVSHDQPDNESKCVLI